MHTSIFFLKTLHPTFFYISLFLTSVSRYSLYSVVDVPEEAEFTLKQALLSGHN